MHLFPSRVWRFSLENDYLEMDGRLTAFRPGHTLSTFDPKGLWPATVCTDPTPEVHIWDVQAGKLAHRVRLPVPVDVEEYRLGSPFIRPALSQGKGGIARPEFSP